MRFPLNLKKLTDIAKNALLASVYYWYLPLLALLVLTGFNLINFLIGSYALSKTIHLASTYLLIMGLFVEIYVSIINQGKLLVRVGLLFLLVVQFFIGSYANMGITIKIVHDLVFWLIFAIIFVLYYKKVLNNSKSAD